MSGRPEAVAAASCMVLPGSARHVATCSVAPSRVRTTKAYVAACGSPYSLSPGV